MEKFVIDTSVTAKLFLENEPYREIAIEVYHQAYQNKIAIFAPTLMCYELNNTFVKERLTNEIIQEHLLVLTKQIEKRVIRLEQPNFKLLSKAAKIAEIDTKGQGYISSYDATFHALALLKKAIFLTADNVHYRKTKDTIGSVMLLQDFPVE